MTKEHAIETRRLAAVAAVLGGACGNRAPAASAPIAGPPETVVVPPASPPPPSAATAAAPPPAETTPANAAPPPPAEPVLYANDLKRICRTNATPKPDRRAPERPGGYRGGRESAEPEEGVQAVRVSHAVDCVVVHDVASTTIDETVTPRCCPPFRGPCPKPYTRKVQGVKALTEMFRVEDDGTVTGRTLFWGVTTPHAEPQHYCGRRPEGFEAHAAIGESELDVLARFAALETASVAAFLRLARELAHHGAPRSLVDRARRASRDEVRHARALVALGAPPSTPLADEGPCRDLEAIARENAVEGCVFETFGALVSTLQAERAETARLRRAFGGIARDERRHAALACDVDAWCASRLSLAARARVDAAREEASHELARRAAKQRPSSRAERRLGLPSPREAAALVSAFWPRAPQISQHLPCQPIDSARDSSQMLSIVS
jgi:hypothetical protein